MIGAFRQYPCAVQRAAAAVRSRAFASAAAAAAPPPPPASASIEAAEIRKFSALAARWWDESPGSPFAGLAALNAVRVPLITRAARAGRTLSGGAPLAPMGDAAALAASRRPLAGLHILDVGCGGGLLAEPLARLGAQVVGLDASPDNAAAAAAHAAIDPELAPPRLRYAAASIEAFADAAAARGGVGAGSPLASLLPPSRGGAAGAGLSLFDAVVVSEVLEHVVDPAPFLAAAASLVAPGGALIATTINRTPAAFALAILAAE
jgi:2-polyprenyl-6-hydroxyphenyl methylase / 3-demethylubiquinone-9 3-methyltransferase